MRKINYRYILSTIVLILVFALGDIDNIYGNDIRFTNINNDDGLSQSTAETIIQDKEGYVWIGTNDGLNKYNGYDFKVYRHDQWSDNSITNNYIVSLKEDKEGNIWVGTANGLSKINPSRDKITNYYKGKDKGNLSNDNIGDILLTKDGDLLVATSNGLNVYDPKLDKFKPILSKEDDLTSQYIRNLEEDNEGNIWIGTKDGLNKVDINKKKVYKYKHQEDKNSISGDNIYGLFYDKKGYMWVGTFTKGLNRIDLKTNEIKSYINNPSDSKSIPGNFIRDIYRDSHGTLWVGTDKGLSKLNKDDTFRTYKNQYGDNNSISQDNVFEIMEDKSGLMWVGTYSGISMFDPNNKIIHYKSTLLDDNALSENVVHGIYEDNEGFLWVGTKSKGVNIIDRKKDKIYHPKIDGSRNWLSDNSINDIKGKGNEVYIATKNGLNIVDKSKRKVSVYNKSNGLCDNDIRSIFLDSKGYLWIGTPNGVCIMNTSDNTINDLSSLVNDKSLDSVFAKVIYEDKEGIYWIGCFIDNALIRIDLDKKTVKRYKHDKKDKKSISSDSVRAITEDKDSNLWVGTSYGLSKLDKKTNTFTNYTTVDGLSNNIIYGILIDNQGDLWLSTNLGISKLNVKDNTFENFGVTDGLQGNEFNGNAAYKNKNDELMFGGINGLNIFKPSDINTKEYTPKVMFDDFEINGKKYGDINNMEFKHNENFLNITLFLPDYRNTKNVQYYYRLDGTKEGWREVESNDINYSRLDPGDYTLSVKARSHNGIITDENHVSFKIKPHFLKSDVAFLIYLIIIVLIVYWYVNRVNYLDNMVKKRTSQLRNEMQKSKDLLNKVIDLERNKNNYFINLSHELRTPLNVIHTTEQLISEFNRSGVGIEQEKLSQYMVVMRRNTSRLLKLINNIIDTTKIDHGKYKLQLEEKDIVYIVEEAALSLKAYIENKGVELIIDPEIEEKYIMCDAGEIERCIVNLVSNAAKFTHKGGTIIVSVKEEHKKTIITVEDTGIGIDEKFHDLVFNRFNQVVDANSEVKGGSGLGLTITKQIIELHKGKIYLESEVNKGTKFTIVL